jgi:hypothetical protein
LGGKEAHDEKDKDSKIEQDDGDNKEANNEVSNPLCSSL